MPEHAPPSAMDAGLVASVCVDRNADSGPRKVASIWVVMARRAEDIAELSGDSAWQALLSDGGRVWTDDFSNVVGAIQWRMGLDRLLPTSLQQSANDEAALYCSRGAAFYKQQDFAEAIACYQEALQIAPNSAEAHHNLGNALASRGRFSEAVKTAHKAANLAAQRNQRALAESIETQIPPYEAETPFRETPPSR
jgi:tetratricopeptide (TPR) repeat protein